MNSSKFILYLLVSITFINCKNNAKIIKATTEYYPSRSLFEESDKLSKIDLSQPDLNFRDVTDSIYDIYEKGMVPYFEIKDRALTRKIMPFHSDYPSSGQNYLRITEDSILSFFEPDRPLDELGRIMKTYYENNGKIPYYPDGPDKTSFEITLDTAAKGPIIIKSLNRLINNFKRVNNQVEDSLELKITFNYQRQIPPPPPYPE